MFQDKMEEDIMSGRYDDKDDFTVVLQPFFHNTPAPFTEVGIPFSNHTQMKNSVDTIVVIQSYQSIIILYTSTSILNRNWLIHRP